MLKRIAAATLFAVGLASGNALAQDTVKIGLILPMTGPFASTGRQIDGGIKLWMQQNGTTVAGKKIEVILKDDAGNADTTRRARAAGTVRSPDCARGHASCRRPARRRR